MAQVEKLTNGPSVTVRMKESEYRIFMRMVERRGMEKSEYIRHLVDLDIERERAEFLALHRVFGSDDSDATNTRGDDE